MMKNTAVHHIFKNVPVISEEATCEEVIALLKSNTTYEYIERIYLVDKERQLKGWLKASQLFTLAADQKVATVMNTKLPVVFPETDQEKLASLAIRHRLSHIPIVDRNKHFLGVVPAQAIIRILRKEHIEDLHRLGGITQEIAHIQESVTEAPTTRVRHRIPWLLAGLGGSMLATYLMSGFEQMLQINIALSFFIPGIVYLADAIGAQSVTIAVRGLSLSKVSFVRMILGELKTGSIIGLILGLVYLPFSWFLFNNLPLAITVSLTIFFAGSIATSIGIIFPWILNAMKIDPAFGSGPIATIIQDILSILIYFMIAYAILL